MWCKLFHCTVYICTVNSVSSLYVHSVSIIFIDEACIFSIFNCIINFYCELHVQRNKSYEVCHYEVVFEPLKFFLSATFVVEWLADCHVYIKILLFCNVIFKSCFWKKQLKVELISNFNPLFFATDFAEKIPEDVREQVLMTNVLPCVKVWYKRNIAVAVYFLLHINRKKHHQSLI